MVICRRLHEVLVCIAGPCGENEVLLLELLDNLLTVLREHLECVGTILFPRHTTH